jgi:hypothetical protein
MCIQSAFEDISLHSKDGLVVTHLRVPQYQSPIEVIGWGSRIFIFNSKKYVEGIM